MLKSLAVTAISLTALGCASLEANRHCALSDAEQCTPSLARHASLDVLKKNGKSFTVACPFQLRPLTNKDRAYCSKQIAAVVNRLNERWSGELAPINLEDVSFKEKSGEIPLYQKGQKYPSDMVSRHQIIVAIPLAWKQ